MPNQYEPTRFSVSWEGKIYDIFSIWADKKDESLYWKSYMEDVISSGCIIPSKLQINNNIPLESLVQLEKFIPQKTSLHSSGYIHETGRHGERNKKFDGRKATSLNEIKSFKKLFTIIPMHPVNYRLGKKPSHNIDVKNLDLIPFVISVWISKDGFDLKKELQTIRMRPKATFQLKNFLPKLGLDVTASFHKSIKAEFCSFQAVVYNN